MNLFSAIEPDWETRYLQAMKQLGLASDDSDARRAAMRFKLTEPTKILLISVNNQMGMLNDISVSGLSFFLESGLRTGDPIMISIDQKFTGHVNVVDSYQVQEGNVLRDGMFRISAKFIEPEDGYRCMVNTLRLMGNIV